MRLPPSWERNGVVGAAGLGLAALVYVGIQWCEDVEGGDHLITVDVVPLSMSLPERS